MTGITTHNVYWNEHRRVKTPQTHKKENIYRVNERVTV